MSFSRKANIESVRAGSIQTPFGPLREGPQTNFFRVRSRPHFLWYFSRLLALWVEFMSPCEFQGSPLAPIGTQIDNIFHEKSGLVTIGTANGIPNHPKDTETTPKVPQII